MTSLGLSLVLAAAFCHATWNLFVKRIGGGPELIWLFSVVAVVLYLPLAAWILVVERPALGWVHLGVLAGSSALHMAYFLLLQTGYRNGDLSLVYPTARASGPVLSSALAVLVLGETVTPQLLAGAAVIIAGVLFLTGGGRRAGGGGPRAGGGGQMSSSLLFGLGAGALIGTYTAWDAHAVAALMVPPLLLDYASSLGRTVLLAPLAHRRRDRVAALWRDHRWGVVVIAAFNPLAYILVLYALTFTPVVYVAPVREVSVLLSVLAGSLLLGEGDLARRLGWALVIFAGLGVLVTA